VIGTAGWIRTTDLLIHSQQQAIDFPTVGSKPNFALLKINAKIGSPVLFQLSQILPSDRAPSKAEPSRASSLLNLTGAQPRPAQSS